MPNSQPSAIPSVVLPAGGKLLAFVDPMTQSTDCATTTNLQTQLAPVIAAMLCQFRILNLLKPLIEIVHSLPSPPAGALAQFSKAAAELAPCLLAPTPASVLPFIRDVLCLEIRSLRCFLKNLETVAALAKTGAAAASGVQNVLDSYPPIAGLLEPAGGLFQMPGISLPSPPVLATGTDPGSLDADRAAVADFVASLQVVADTLGGCSS